MRTSQVAGEGELGFVLAVPCVTVNPDRQIQSYLNIKKKKKTADLILKTLNVEIDPYNIDATQENSNEQYVSRKLPKPMCS